MRKTLALLVLPALLGCKYESLVVGETYITGTVRLDRGRVLVGDTAGAEVRVHVFNQAHIPIVDRTVTFASDNQLVEITQPGKTDAEGVAVGRVRASAATEVRLEVTLETNGELIKLPESPVIYFVTEPTDSLELAHAAVVTVGAAPRDVAVADVDGDGMRDIVTANRGSDSISVIFGRGAGKFSAATHVVVPGQPMAVRTIELDGQAGEEILVAQGAEASVSVLTHAGSHAFTSIGTIATKSQPRDMTIGDVNGDGRKDLIVACTGSHRLTVHHGTTDTTNAIGGSALAFAKVHSGVVETLLSPAAVSIADVNADGNADLVVLNTSSRVISVHAGKGAGLFETPVSITTAGPPLAMSAGQWSSSDKDVIAVAMTNDVTPVAVFRESADDPALYTSLAEIDGLGSVQGLLVADLTSDGVADIVAADASKNTVTLYPGNGTGGLSAITLSLATGAHPTGLAVADLDANGWNDLIVSNYDAGTVDIFLTR